MTTDTTTVRYEPRGAALEIFKNRSPELAICGPAGTGKSLACLYRLHLTALNNPDARFLIVRKTATSLGSTTLVTFENKVIKDAKKAGIVRWYGGSPREAPCYRYSNGSVIVVGGMDKPDKIMSSEYDIIFADEATELTIDDWEAMGTRLRNGILSWQQQIAACNPSHPTHWLRGRGDQGLVMLTSRHRDNPAYVNADGTYTEKGAAYLAKLDNLTGVRRLRLRDGTWAAAEGLVYEGWDDAVHLVDRLPKGSERWARWWSIDFGFSNPFVLQCWAEDPDGALWLHREIYKTKTLVEDHAAKILSLVRKPRAGLGRPADPKRSVDWEWTEPKPKAIICDHDAEDRATFERHAGLSTIAAKKTVSDGVQAVQARLKVQPNGRARIYVVRDSLVEADPELDEAKKPTCLTDEIAGYVWPAGVKPDKREAPVKEDDHSCLIAGTRIETARGPVPIEGIQAGDQVLTRRGLKVVTASGMTAVDARVYRVTFSNGATLTGTGNHPVWVAGSGWTRLDALRYADTISACQTSNPYGSTASPSVATLTRQTGRTVATSPPGSPTANAASGGFTKKSGRRRTARFQKAATSITQTSTRSTTNRTTLSALRRRSTPRPIRGAGVRGYAAPKVKRTLSASGQMPPRGTRRLRVLNGIAGTRSRWVSVNTSPARFSAVTAAPSTKREVAPVRRGFALTSARRQRGVCLALTTSNGSARSAARRSSSTATPPPLAADVSVLSVCELATNVPVFNLTVADAAEYFAEGVLVHNCDAMRYMVAHRDLGARPGIRVVR